MTFLVTRMGRHFADNVCPFLCQINKWLASSVVQGWMAPRLMCGLSKAFPEIRVTPFFHSAAWLCSWGGQAFKSYDEAGAVRRIQCLKYLVLATMLMESAVDPFDAQARLCLAHSLPQRTDIPCSSASTPRF